ncbi:MAG: DUF5050 domain-containing protein [Rhodanobacter sp.]
MAQNQIGNNKTASSPFITANNVVYFQGTDYKLWKINADGTGQIQIGTNTTKSTPCVFDDPMTGEWVYFQGTDDKLWKVRGDSVGSSLTQIGHNKTSSTPFVTYDNNAGIVWVYFQGTDNKLWKVHADGSGQTQIGSNTTASTPFVFTDPIGGEWIYFQGTDNRLWKVRSDSAGSNLTQIGTNTTSSTPVATFDSNTGIVWVYFQGTDNRLWKVQNDSAGTGLFNIGGNTTASSPCVTPDGWVYFRGTDNRLLKVFNDGTQGAQLGGNTTLSKPKVDRIALADGTVEEWVYFQGTDDKLWRYFGLLGGMLVPFTARQNGWHFNNDFVNHLFGILTTQGLCGGMAYSSLDYYFSDLPIPTHRKGDFGSADATVPPDGRLHSMIFSRLIDSFADNFGKWSCIYPALDAVAAAALGLVTGGLLGSLVGAVWGGIYGELHEVFSCPSGGPAGMTRQELPNLTKNFLDKGIPVPIGLIFDDDVLHIGQSHQVVAYGYSMNGTTMTINIYDNRFHDEECTLVVDTSNPGAIPEYSTTQGKPTGDHWAGLLVADGYTPQWPSYGPDISIAQPQSLQLSGPVVTAPIAVGAATSAATTSVPSPFRAGPLQGLANQILMVAQQQQAIGDALVDTYSVQNYGEFSAHYASLGIEVEAPGGSDTTALAIAAASDNQLAPGATLAVTISIANFGSTPGNYSLISGYNSVGLNGQGAWFRMLYPPASITAAAASIIQ